MSDRDYQAYHDLYEGIRAFLPSPDLLVYLRGSVDTLVSRIKLRGREYERDISLDYLQRLNTLYDEWIGRWESCPVLIIPTDELDFQHDPRARRLVIDGVSDSLKPAPIRYLKLPG